MCGLAGVAGTVTPDGVKVFKDLLMMAAFRGRDSTGVAVVPYTKPEVFVEPVILKSTVDAMQFLDLNKANQIISPNNAVLLGHGRSATWGKINRESAQPFEMGDVVGTHNGTLSGKAKNLLEGPKQCLSTDSMALFDSINKNGLKDTLDLMEDDDAMAIVYYDNSDNTINLYRNHCRPLWYALDKDHKSLFWASESGSLYWALNRHKIAFKKVHELGAFNHLSFVLPEKQGERLPRASLTRIAMREHKPYNVKNSAADAARVFDTATKTGQSVIPFPRTTVSVTHSNASTTSHGITVHGAATHSLITPPNLVEEAKWKPSTMQSRSDKDGGDFYYDANGHGMNEKEFTDRMDQGCAMNGCVPTFGEPVKFLKDGSFVCANCLADLVGGSDKDTLEIISSML